MLFKFMHQFSSVSILQHVPFIRITINRINLFYESVYWKKKSKNIFLSFIGIILLLQSMSVNLRLRLRLPKFINCTSIEFDPPLSNTMDRCSTVINKTRLLYLQRISFFFILHQNKSHINSLLMNTYVYT